MVRPAKTPEIIDVPAIDEQHVHADLQTLNQVARIEDQHAATVRVTAAKVGYQLPADCTDPDLIQRDVAANMRRSVEACLEVGRGLAVLKAACGHGEFIARLDVLGLDRYVAARFIQAATKFANVPTSAHLTKAIGNQSKLFEMLVLEDEQIEELAMTGQTGELRLDDIATMSVKEVRAKAREERERRIALERMCSEKDQKITELAVQEAVARPVTRPWDEFFRNLRAEIAAHFDIMDESAARLETLHNAVTQGDLGEAEDEEGADKKRRALAVMYGDRLKRVSQVLAKAQHLYDHILGGWAEELDNQILPAHEGAEG